MQGFGHIEGSKREGMKASSNKLVNLALEHHAKGNISKALNLYNQIITEGIEDPRVYSGLGLIALQDSRIDAALKYNLKSISIAPYYSPAYSNASVILAKKGKLMEAEKYIRKAIAINPKSPHAYLNLADILYKRIDLHEAEENTRKSINIQPSNLSAYYLLSKILRSSGNHSNAEAVIIKAIKLDKQNADSYCLLAEVYKEVGNMDKARLNLHKAIKLNPAFANAYFSLSTLNDCDKDNILNRELSKIDIEKVDNNKDKIDFYFAKSNIYYKKGLFRECAKCLQDANNLKLSIYPSSGEQLINKSKEYLIKSNNIIANIPLELDQLEECIFLVGMPRSGSTLVETILSANKNVVDLGERPLIENSLKALSFDLSKSIDREKFHNLYLKERAKFTKKGSISTDKYLYNYLYLGYILSSIPYAKIIHCFRNPLDNILSIYRANFGEGVRFSSSLKDCARVYIDQDKILNEYKIKFTSQIYSLNYDLMVTNPDYEIKKLISWLNWDWDDMYLEPHKVNRNVTTASVVQVRSPINSKSLGGWHNFKKMLQPAIEILQDHSLSFN